MVKTVLVRWEPLSEVPLLQSFKKPKVKVNAFVQARKTSSRLPNKIYQPIAGVPMLYHVLDRVKRASLVDEVVVCAPHQLDDLPEGVSQFVHYDEQDVLSRYYHCLQEHKCDYVLRITADCPVLDPHLIDFVIAQGIKANADYCSNVLKPTFPDGVDCELISKRMLCFLHATMNSDYAREHVTIGIRDNKKLRDQFNLVSVECMDKDYSSAKWSVDTQADLDRVRGFL
jgi:spore coat polysaccharide biosynthesis protein SpsF (cytidylyltransferase family)